MTDLFLYRHAEGYKLSTNKALQSPFVSPYGTRHFDLSKSSNISSTQRWGHRVIACIESLPILGVFASLIERILSIVYNLLQKPSSKNCSQKKADHSAPSTKVISTNVQTHTPIQKLSNPFECFSRDLISKYADYLSIHDAGNYANVMGTHDRKYIWMSQARRFGIKVSAGEAPAKVRLRTLKRAEELLNFFSLTGFCPDEIINNQSKNVFEKANALRAWLKNYQNVKTCTRICLTGYKIKAIPPEIGNLVNLQYLELTNNQITSIPAEIGNLVKLTHINLGSNQITSIPSEIGNLVNLEGLELGRNQITSIPAEIGRLVNLQYLEFTNNQITSIPAEIGRLVNLQYLELTNNQITSIPAEIGNLVNLENLDLSFNQITSIPAEIGRLVNLQRLYLNDNQITSIPSEVANLVNRGILHL
jgi:hypothetical protein